MKIKLLVAAIAIASSANVSAAILSPIEAFGQSEAVFSIWDPTVNQSYAIDLGTTWQTFRDNLSNASYSVSYAIDTTSGSVYNQALGGSDTANLVWNVSVADSQLASYANFEDFGVIGTSNSGTTLDQSSLDQAINAHKGYANNLRGTTPVVNNDPALNDEYFGTVANGGYSGSGFIWNTSWGTNALDNSASFGTDLDFYYWQTSGFNPAPGMTKAAGSWSFDGSTLAYGAAPVSAVPVPAAAWLFGSGLIGLVGVSRRKTDTV